MVNAKLADCDRLTHADRNDQGVNMLSLQTRKALGRTV
jgi:hypothetical protein